MKGVHPGHYGVQRGRHYDRPQNLGHPIVWLELQGGPGEHKETVDLLVSAPSG